MRRILGLIICSLLALAVPARAQTIGSGGQGGSTGLPIFATITQGGYSAVVSASGALSVAENYANLATNQVTVGVTATLIVAARTGRKNVTIIQEGNTLVRVGASGVTLLTGVPLIGTQGVNLVIDGGAAVYGIAGSDQLVSFMEVY